jgi:hypothetical protein
MMQPWRQLINLECYKYLGFSLLLRGWTIDCLVGGIRNVHQFIGQKWSLAIHLLQKLLDPKQENPY